MNYFVLEKFSLIINTKSEETVMNETFAAHLFLPHLLLTNMFFQPNIDFKSGPRKLPWCRSTPAGAPSDRGEKKVL